MQLKKKYSIFIIQYLMIAFVMLMVSVPSYAQYKLLINYSDKDTSFTAALKLQTNFTNKLLCAEYIKKLPSLLSSKGYPTASVDDVKLDSSFAVVQLFAGEQQNYILIQTGGIEKSALYETGMINKNKDYNKIDFSRLQVLQQNLLNYFENNGYPFAAVSLDNVRIDSGVMKAVLKTEKGPLYHIDSIRVYGKINISNFLLQRYLEIPNGSIYKKNRLLQISKKLAELPYLQEVQQWDITMLGTGSVLNLYLNPKKSSQVNFLLGFLPAGNDNNKLRLTGDVNLNLKNALGKGESILLNWQQLQAKSPRLNIGFQQPYIFKSAFGFDFSFDLFKKDTTYLQINAQAGLQYLMTANQSGKIFFQNQSSFLLGSGVDTNSVKVTKKLPSNIDVSAMSVGLDYEWNNTNYKYNPVSGNELQLITSAGIKTIKKNNDIINLKDPQFDYNTLYDSIKLSSYQLKIQLYGAHYFPTGKLSTLKMSLNAALYSSPEIFRNDLFQIGGYKLLRGFDEESIYATQYGVASVEYRYLTALNSYFFGFIDAGLVKNKFQAVNVQNFFLSSGVGLVFETKMGLLKLSYALGKRDDVAFDIRRASKIHFGYINYF